MYGAYTNLASNRSFGKLKKSFFVRSRRTATGQISHVQALEVRGREPHQYPLYRILREFGKIHYLVNFST